MRAPQGGDLWNALAHTKSGRLNWYARGRQIGLDVARGLVHLHSRNVVHLVRFWLLMYPTRQEPLYVSCLLNLPINPHYLRLVWGGSPFRTVGDRLSFTFRQCADAYAARVAEHAEVKLKSWMRLQDLKSPNILLGKDTTAKIADVGLARSVTSDAACLSQMTAVCFT